jgi:hypothetical protein
MVSKKIWEASYAMADVALDFLGDKERTLVLKMVRP